MSDMVQNWIFLCVFMTVIKPYATVSVTHVGYPINWLQTTGMCKKNGIEFEENVLRDSDILQGKMFWIGKAIYSKTSDWIEIIGCYEVTDTTGMKTIAKITYLGECQIKCKAVLPLLQNNQPSYFGYNETSKVCVCAIYLPFEKKDILHCENKKALNSYFFYKVYQEAVSEKQGAQEHCTILKCLGGHNRLKAINCLSTHQAGRCGNGLAFQWGQAYNSYLNACKSKNQLLLAPSLYCKLEGHYDEGIESWTNVFRKVYKVQLTNAEAETEPLKCLAGTLTNDTGKWNFNTLEMNCSVGFEWFLCRGAATQSFTVTTAVFPATSLLTFSKSRSGTASAPERTSYVNYSTALPGLNKNSKQTTHPNDNSFSRTIGAVIGGLIGACSIIALIAVLIVCKVRSIGLFKQSPKHDRKESSQMEFSKAVYQDSMSLLRRKVQHSHQTKLTDLLKTEH